MREHKYSEAAKRAWVTRRQRASVGKGQGTGQPIRALSIRQPYAEQILRGTKKLEYRNRPTHIRERVYIYASLTPGFAEDFAAMRAQPGDFPSGVLVGTVEIADCRHGPQCYEWLLRKPQRLARPLAPKKHPQPGWFKPF